jgi:hypothetical protein
MKTADTQSLRYSVKTSSFVVIALLALSTVTMAQSTNVPRLMRYGGKVPSSPGVSTTLVTNLTFSLYNTEQGGSPLWSEHQNVEISADGRYEVLLGASSAQGLPLELFTSTEAQWLGVRTEDGQELPRQQLTSASYALKALDAATLGGYPVSSFLLQSKSTTEPPLSSSQSGIQLNANVVINPGSANYLAKFLDPSTIVSSNVTENTTGVGLDVVTPSQKLDIFGRMKLRARGSATSGLWLTDPNGAEQLFFGQIGLDSTSPLGVWHGGAWRFAMTNAGDVGIGVGIAPSAKLDLGGRAVFRSSSQGSSGFWLTSADGVRTLFVGQKGITSADAFGIWHGGAWRFAVDKSGNVGVGVDPLFRMDILGRMRLRASGTQPSGTWFSGETDTPQLFLGQTDIVASAPFGIMHGGNWRFLLRSDGKIGIGTTAPSELLEVAGNLKLSSGGKLVFPDGTSMATASSGSSSVTSTDPAIIVTTSASTSQLSLATAGIGTTKLADNSVTTSKIADGAITSSKFAAPLSPAVISGVAATLGSNQFLGSQTIQGAVTIADKLQVQNQTAMSQLAVSFESSVDHALTARNIAINGTGAAMRAETSSPDGTAISAVTLATTGGSIAVNARTNSPTGQGVYGEAAFPSGLNFGVRGISRSSQGVGVQGEALGTTGPAYGVVGITGADNGSAAVYAQSNSAAILSPSYGVLAKNQGVNGVAVFAHAQSLSGATYGIYGRVDSASGIAGMFMTSASSGTVIAANNASRRIFRVDTSGNVFALGTFSPNGADFAESVAIRGSRTDYQPGDVMVIDPDNDRQFLLSEEPYSTKVAGVFSTKPGILGSRKAIELNDAEIPLAMIGIVPCRVSTENGPIHRGDLLVTSSIKGVAMRGTDKSKMQGAVIGKALQNLSEGTGTIEILVTLQ